MKEGNTTLSVPKEFAEHLRKDFSGSNDFERLENWASDIGKDSYNKDITNEDLLEAIEENQTSYNNPITIENMEDLMRRLSIDGRTGDVILE